MMSCWPTGVAIVTSRTGATPAGCTVNAVTSVSTDPPLLLVALSSDSRTLAAIRQTRRLGVNMLSAGQQDLTARFARADPEDRFTGLDSRWVLGIPILRGAVVGAVCEVEDELPVADHVLVVAAPIWQIMNVHASPSVYFRRTFWSLCEQSASHGAGPDRG
jgi:flavin reductase (DIM6/NTAB) family NADH-FMN oxidoreductase RutF